MIKAVIFDFDGTLIDSIEVIINVLGDALRALGIEGDPKKAEPLIGMNAWKIVEAVTGLKSFEDQDKVVQEWARRYLIAILKEGRVPLSTHVDQVLRKLKELGIKVGIASSLKRSIIKDLINHYDIGIYIDAYVGTDEVKNSKPAPDIFIETAKRLGVDPKECVVVGDSAYDIIGGSKMGAVTVLYNPKLKKVDTPVKPDFVIRKMTELLTIIRIFL
ncbi:MAG: HAD family hydrolase [Candidatus Asgardarchaeia archaeon]